VATRVTEHLDVALALTFRAAVPHLSDGGGVLLACGSSLAIRPGAQLLPYAYGGLTAPTATWMVRPRTPT
jgi:hypothetical protein